MANTAPTLDLNGAESGVNATAYYAAGYAPTVIVPAALLTDPDSADFGGGSLTIQPLSGQTSDQYGIFNQGNGLGQIGVSGNAVSYGGVQIGTFSGGTGPSQFTVTFNTSATPVAVQALLHAITFFNPNAAPATVTRISQWTLTDGDGGTSNAANINLTLDHAAVVDLNSGTAGTGDSLFFTEGQASIPIGTAITITDSDGGDSVHGARITITDAAAGDALLATLPLPPGITVDPASTATTIILTGTASAANYATALALIGFTNSGDNPTEFDTHLTRTVTVTVNDGHVDGPLATATIQISADDDPSANVVPVSVSGTEDTALVFAGATKISVHNDDPGAVSMTLDVSHGTLTLSGVTGLTVTGNGTANVTLAGSLTDVNAALDGLTYLGDPNYHGTDDLYVHHQSGVTADTDVIPITLAADGHVDGRAGDDILTGTGGADMILVSQGGADHVTAGNGNDFIFYGDAFDGNDTNDGGAGTDTVGLLGNYDLTFGADSMVGIERLALYAGNYNDPAGGLVNYRITTIDATVEGTDLLAVNARSLRAGETLTFIGVAETTGSFHVEGGAGDDIIAGGAGNDMLIGGAGNDALYGQGGRDILNGGLGADQLRGGAGIDQFFYASAADSTSFNYDTIAVFDAREDKIDLAQTVNGWSGTITHGALSTGSFDVDMASAVDATLQAHSAVLFTADSGTLAGTTFAIVDADGDGAYTAGNDYVFAMSGLFIAPTGYDIFV
jgi:Ca2+-binding RTX toxin-like protein